MKGNNDTYFYTCPKSLGHLEICLDAESKIEKARFVDVQSVGSVSLPNNISKYLDEYFNQKHNLPLDLISDKMVGTQFQISIWKVIREIPFGSTINYTELAKRAGNTRAIRAAGTACGHNPIALFIPCHRIVLKSGENYGYSWGIDRKKWLLDYESSI
jgi:O-6-methylguanine DNA methyltransferase